jgi:hypothetical protein
MAQWVSVLNEWSSYGLEQLDYMSLPQGHPLYTRRENLRRQQQLNEADEETRSGEEMMGRICRTDTNRFLSTETASEASLATEATSEVGKERREDDAYGHVAKAWSNTQKDVDERYAAKARVRAAARHSTNDKNQDDIMNKEVENDELCSEDPAMQDESAAARLPEEATLREIRQIGFWA